MGSSKEPITDDPSPKLRPRKAKGTSMIVSSHSDSNARLIQSTVAVGLGAGVAASLAAAKVDTSYKRWSLKIGRCAPTGVEVNIVA